MKAKVLIPIQRLEGVQLVYSTILISCCGTCEYGRFQSPHWLNFKGPGDLSTK